MVDNKKINEVLRYIVVNDCYESITQYLSFEERKRLLFGNSDEFKLLELRAIYIYRNLFTEDEADLLYKEINDNDIKSILLLCCSDDVKLEEIKYSDSYLLTFIGNFNDDNKRFMAFENLLINKKLSIYDIPGCIDCFNSDMHNKIIDLVSEYNKSSDTFDLTLYNVKYILEKCSDSNKELFLDKLLISLVKKIGDKKIEYYGYIDIIEIFPINKKLNVFRKFLDLNKNEKIEISKYNLSIILKSVDDDIKFDFIKEFLNSGLLDDCYIVSNIFDEIPDDMKDEALNIFYEYDLSNEKKLITEYIINEIVMKYSLDKRLEKFKELVIDSKKFNDFEVIRRFSYSDVNFCFETLNLKIKEVVSRIDDSKKEDLFIYLNHYFNNNLNKMADGNIIYLDLINFYVDYLGLDRDNFISFIERFGYVSLRYLDNNNIRDFINLDKNNFNKIISLFDKDNLLLDNDTINNVVHSILQREFMLQCRSDYNIFSKLEELIHTSSLEEVKNIFLDISGVINIDKILGKYNISKIEFFNKLFNGDDKALDILHDITDLYIMKKREEYVNKRLVGINDELDLVKKYEKNFIKKKYIATTSLRDISFNIRFSITRELSEEQLELTRDGQALDEIIKFKKSPLEFPLDSSYKKYLKVFEELLNILYLEDKLKDPTNDVNAKYIYNPKHIDEEYLLGVISELDIDNICKFLLVDDVNFNKLKDIFSKYKILDWNRTFNSLEKSADFEFDSSTISGLINYFYRINSELGEDNDNKFSLTKMVSLANCYSSASSKYSFLFGHDVYKLIAANEGKNKASMAKYKRLSLGVEHVIGMYDRNNIPVPAMDCNLNLNNGKEINVIVGNVTSMDNLVLGEMTESCSRIGGAFYDFYKECLEGELGFNIVYRNPENGEFVSRVSGIRNGNTLFLNELRDSVCDKYSNEDCVEAMILVAKLLVEKSKDSEFPIDNVVITADYAMNRHTEELVDLHLESRREAVLGLHHNLNIDGKAIVLATSNNDDSLVSVKLGPKNVSYYKPQRDKVNIYHGKDAIYRVVQLENMINGILNGENLADINFDLNQDIVSCISGDDWFISIDSSGNIKEFILDKSNDRDRALEEMKYYLEMIKDNSFDIRKGVNR